MWKILMATVIDDFNKLIGDAIQQCMTTKQIADFVSLVPFAIPIYEHERLKIKWANQMNFK